MINSYTSLHNLVVKPAKDLGPASGRPLQTRVLQIGPKGSSDGETLCVVDEKKHGSKLVSRMWWSVLHKYEGKHETRRNANKKPKVRAIYQLIEHAFCDWARRQREEPAQSAPAAPAAPAVAPPEPMQVEQPAQGEGSSDVAAEVTAEEDTAVEAAAAPAEEDEWEVEPAAAVAALEAEADAAQEAPQSEPEPAPEPEPALEPAAEPAPVVPEAFLCPITFELMRDPVIALDGLTYERVAIEQWLATHDTSPLTGAVLASKMLIPNVFARSQILERCSSR